MMPSRHVVGLESLDSYNLQRVLRIGSPVILGFLALRQWTLLSAVMC